MVEYDYESCFSLATKVSQKSSRKTNHNPNITSFVIGLIRLFRRKKTTENTKSSIVYNVIMVSKISPGEKSAFLKEYLRGKASEYQKVVSERWRGNTFL